MLFSGGVFVIIASVLRAYFILNGGREGGRDAAYWGIRETFVAFVIGNIPPIYAGFRVWLRKVMSSKVYATIRPRTKDSLGANGRSGLFWRARRGRDGPAFEQHSSAKKFAMLSSTESNSSSSRPRRLSSLPWDFNHPGSRIDTDVRSSNTYLAEMDSGLGIQVTRGIKVDVESVRSRQSDAETIGRSSENAGADSKVYLGPFLTESPHLGRGSEMPTADRPIRQSTLSPPADSQEIRSATTDGPNFTKWISADSP
jgi:hypothetical protein